MQEITADSIIGIHDTILAEAGGDMRGLSEGNLHQMVFRANLTEDPLSCAALVFYSLCAYPAFREGNRRTACRLVESILATGGFSADLPCEELRELARGIDTFSVEIDDVERFLRQRAAKIH